MEGKQGINTNVANILKQLSFKEINEDSDDNRSNNSHYHHLDSDSHNSNDNSDELIYYGLNLRLTESWLSYLLILSIHH